MLSLDSVSLVGVLPVEPQNEQANSRDRVPVQAMQASGFADDLLFFESQESSLLLDDRSGPNSGTLFVLFTYKDRLFTDFLFRIFRRIYPNIYSSVRYLTFL